MAVTRRDLNRHRWTPRVYLHPSLVFPQLPMYRGFNLFAWGLFLIALSMAVTSLWSFGQARLDDLRYGPTRAFHLTQHVGHGGNGQPSHLIALNLDRQVVVIDIPGSDPSQTRTIVGPYLFGANENLTPVLLDLHDYNNDAMLDLVVKVKNEKLVYINQDGAFRPITADERLQFLSR